MQPSPISSPYIVEHADEVSLVDIATTEVIQLHSLYEKYAVICRFHGYWPPTTAL